jgi:hypothetical protein
MKALTKTALPGWAARFFPVYSINDLIISAHFSYPD